MAQQSLIGASLTERELTFVCLSPEGQACKMEKRGGSPRFIPSSRIFPELCLLLAVEGIAQAGSVRRLVVLALHHVLRASVVEPEDFVIQIQSIGIEGEAARDLVASLDIKLEVRVQIIV